MEKLQAQPPFSSNNQTTMVKCLCLKIQAQFNDLFFLYIYIYILFLQIHGFQHFEKRSLSLVNQESYKYPTVKKKKTKTNHFDKKTLNKITKKTWK